MFVDALDVVMAAQIHRVNIRTRDLEGTVAFYAEAVGLTTATGRISVFRRLALWRREAGRPPQSRR